MMAGDGAHGFSPLMGHWIAGILATLREFTLLYAPTINSYKRFAKGSVRAHRHRVGRRQPHVRAARDRPRPSLRVENRVPGGDVNPYLGISAIIAGGLHGIENELALPDPLAGNAYTSGVDQLPTTLREAAQLFERVGDRPRGVRRRDGRALPQPGAHRGRGLRRRRDGLGAGAWFRTTLSCDRSRRRRSSA